MRTLLAAVGQHHPLGQLSVVGETAELRGVPVGMHHGNRRVDVPQQVASMRKPLDLITHALEQRAPCHTADRGYTFDSAGQSLLIDAQRKRSRRKWGVRRSLTRRPETTASSRRSNSRARNDAASRAAILRLASSRSRIRPAGNSRTGRAFCGPATQTLDSSPEGASRTAGWAWRPFRASHNLRSSALLAAPSVQRTRQAGVSRPSLTHRAAKSSRAQGRRRPQGVRPSGWQRVSSSAYVLYSWRFDDL